MRYFLTLLYCLSLASLNAQAQDAEGFSRWLKEFRKEAPTLGIKQQTIRQNLNHVSFLPRVIELDRKQPHGSISFAQYQERVIPASRIQRARRLYAENKILLEEIGAHYGVQPRFIVALWGIESDFGRNTGGFDIINSLATLAYEGRRAEFFKKELVAALQILEEGHIDRPNMKGSWAGAMGQTQFMPSSFLELAVDYNENGKRNIWQEKADIFGSIANYLSKRGWNNDLTWGREVSIPRNFDEKLLGREITKSLAQWDKIGIRKTDGTPLPNRPELTASIVRPGKNGTQYYLVYDNYNVIMNWNRSLYFATAVGLFSDLIY